MRRKSLLLLFVVVLTSWGMAARAQVHLGVKGGYNYTNWSFGKLDIKSENKSGFFIGPTLKLNLPTMGKTFGFALNVSALYDQRKVRVGETEPVNITSKMVAVPVNLQLDIFRDSSLELFVYAGPEFDFNVDNDERLIDAARTWKFKDSAFSLNAGAGILLLHFVQLSINYNLVCGSTAEVTMRGVTEDVKTFKSRANAGHVALAVYF